MSYPNCDRYFSKMAAREARLRANGLDADCELLEYVLDMNEKVDALCTSIGFEAYRDPRGRWLFLRRNQESLKW